MDLCLDTLDSCLNNDLLFIHRFVKVSILHSLLNKYMQISQDQLIIKFSYVICVIYLRFKFNSVPAKSIRNKWMASSLACHINRKYSLYILQTQHVTDGLADYELRNVLALYIFILVPNINNILYIHRSFDKTLRSSMRARALWYPP